MKRHLFWIGVCAAMTLLTASGDEATPKVSEQIDKALVKGGEAGDACSAAAPATQPDVPLAAVSDDVHAGPVPQRITNDEFFQWGDHGDIYFADVQADRSVRDKAADRLNEAGPAAGSATLPHADAFRIQCRKPADHVAVTVGADTTTFTVISPSGIGSASIERTGAAWPASVILRLDLKGLEGIVISNGQTRLSGSVDRNGVTRLEADGTREIAKGNPLWMEIERDQGVLKMAIPQAMLKTAKTLMIEWVDFFR
jgi:hypothetical protein